MIESMTTLSASETETLKADNREVWGRMAANYATTFEVLTREAAPALLDGAGVGRGTDLLDVGTGPGTLIGPASVMARTVVAHQRRDVAVVEDAVATYFGLPVDDATLVPAGDAEAGSTTLAAWFAQR